MVRTARGRAVGESGFTLIELLVVVAVIGILTALTMPQLIRSMRYAQRTQCASNLRQVGAAIHDYASNNQAYLPSLQGTPGAYNSLWVANKRLMFWFDHLRIPPKLVVCPVFPNWVDFAKHRNANTWYTWPAGSTPESCRHINIGYLHLGERDYGDPASGFTFTSAHYVRDNMARIDYPSRTPYWVDWVVPDNRSAWSHLGDGGNEMMVDLHVEWVNVSKMEPQWHHWSWGDFYWRDETRRASQP